MSARAAILVHAAARHRACAHVWSEAAAAAETLEDREKFARRAQFLELWATELDEAAKGAKAPKESK